MPETNDLQESELAWLKESLIRFIGRTARWFAQHRRLADGGVKDAFLKASIERIAFYWRLLEGKRVLPEDRVSLLPILRYERRMLPSEGGDEGRHQEKDLINGFLRRLSKIDWEALGLPDNPYQPTQIWGSFRLNEAEIGIAAGRLGFEAQFTEDYGSLVRGARICAVATDEGGSQTAYSIQLLRVHDASGAYEPVPGKIFEGVIEDDTDQPDREVFGLLLSDGEAFLVVSSPDSEQVHSCIFTVLAETAAARAARDS